MSASLVGSEMCIRDRSRTAAHRAPSGCGASMPDVRTAALVMSTTTCSRVTKCDLMAASKRL
eukprot:7190060-Alexandrium_andersonii.AAC.1